MSNQIATTAAGIILPGEHRRMQEWCYWKVVAIVGRPHPVAMVKTPKSLEKPFEGALAQDENHHLLWFICDPKDETSEDGGLETTRYQLRGLVKHQEAGPPEGVEPTEWIKSLLADSGQDGYVYFPKALRDGRHDDIYIFQPIDEQEFTTRTERGMFEEVCWSPFGEVDGAVDAEAENLDRNPLMRHWK